jgi:steroid delta-isomerase-like uncharacterized protein
MQMSTETNKTLARRWFAEFNRGNLAAADEIYAPDYVLHDPASPPDVAPGPVGVKQFLSLFLTAFPDTQGTIEDLIAEGSTLVIRFTLRGTHQGEFQGITPMGKPFTISGISIIRCAGGQFVEEWEIFDSLGLLQQLGAVPTAGQGVNS